MNQEILLLDSCGWAQLVINENASNNKTLFQGIFSVADEVNKNGRIYEYNILNENVKRLKPIMESRGLIGEMDHPETSVISYGNASHLITKLWWEDKKLMGEGEILPTPNGLILKKLIEANVRIGISSRSVGTGTTENGIMRISEGLRIISFDAVCDPSVAVAFQKKVVKSENYSEIFETKSIDKINEDAFVLFFGELLKERTKAIKSEIKK